MDLAKELRNSGFEAAKKELDEVKRIREALWNELQLNSTRPDMRERLLDIAALDAAIKNGEAALNAEYDATIKLVDANNDLDLEMLDLAERAEMVLEYVEKELPDHPNTAKIRELVEKIRSNEE